jgi:hypothetical protein
LGLESSFIKGGATRAKNPTGTQLESTQSSERDANGGWGPRGWRCAAFGRSASAPAAHRPLMRLSRAARSKSRGASARSERCCGHRPQRPLRPLAARPKRARSESAPAGTLIAARFYRAGQSNLARLLARRPWTPRPFRAKTMQSTGAPPNAPSARFQLILQVFPTQVCKPEGFASDCPGGQIDLTDPTGQTH